MSVKRVVSQSQSTHATEVSAPPFPILSSAQANWEGMSARAYHEPAEIESAIIPAVPNLSLIMVTHGAVSFESRDRGAMVHGEQTISAWETGFCFLGGRRLNFVGAMEISLLDHSKRFACM